MKITFSNLGAIKKTTLDLRPLTVIIGPNNSNKTYIAYSIYGIWQNLKDFETNYNREIQFNVKKESPLVFTVKTDNRFYETVKTFFRRYPSNFFTELDTFFQDSTGKTFTGAKFEIDISNDEIDEAINFMLFDEDLKDIFGLTATYKDKVIRFESVEDSSILNDEDLNEKYVSEQISFYIRFVLFNSPILLPAERNAFIITYKMLANRRYKHLRQMQRELISRKSEERQLELLKEQGDIRYPQPIEDFLDFLTDVELEILDKTNLEVRQRFSKFADKIEENIQGKNKTQLKSTKFGGKEIKINIKEGLDIDLYNASSSIKQLAPLLFYLRYRAVYSDLLIIDEPEMNLHPESQAKLLEVLGMLVNAGVNVLLTTHSPYFMSHLNNLIAGDMNDEAVREKQAKSLYLEDARAFLKPEDVSAYEMRQNKKGEQTLHDLHDKDYGIRWDTLSDVSADIQQKFFEIYEKGEETSKGKEK